MSKFSIKVKLQALEIEVEGTREDAPKIYQELGKQVSGLLQSPAVLASGNGSSVLEGEVVADNRKTKKTRRIGGGTKTSADELNLAHDPAKYGTPQQGWTQSQKSIWFLHIVGKQANVTQLTTYSLAKNFNKHFKSSGQLNAANVMRGLEKERMKNPATVNADMKDGTAKYFLTVAGTAIAEKLAKGETIAAD